MVSSSKASTFLFVGTERYLKDNELKTLKSSLSGNDPSRLEHKTFYAGEASIGEIIDYVNGSSLFSSKRIAVIRDPERLPSDDRARLLSYIKNPSESAILVMDTDDASMLEDLGDALSHIRVLRFGEMGDSELSAWIARYAAQRHKEISDDASSALKELAGRSLLVLSNELEKLITYVGRRSAIGLEDVENLVGKSVIASGFDIAWAIGERNMRKARAIVSDLIAAGKRPYEIIGLISWHLNRVLKAKRLHASGESNFTIANALKIHRRYHAQFFEQVRSFGIDQLKSKLDTLLEADTGMKRSRLDHALLIDLVIVRLCLG